MNLRPITYSCASKTIQNDDLLSDTRQPFVGCHRRQPQDSRRRENVVLKESRFDSRHGEGNRFNRVVQDSKCPCKLDCLDVTNVLWEKSQALMKTIWSVRREWKEMWSILRYLKRLHRTVTLG